MTRPTPIYAVPRSEWARIARAYRDYGKTLPEIATGYRTTPGRIKTLLKLEQVPLREEDV